MDYYSIDVEATGKNLKQICKRKDVTAGDLMSLLHFTTPTAVYKWYSGRNLPSMDNMIVIARFLEVGVEDIVVIKCSEDTGQRKEINL